MGRRLTSYLFIAFSLYCNAFTQHNVTDNVNAADASLKFLQDTVLHNQAKTSLSLVNEVLESKTPQFPEPVERTLALTLLDVLFNDQDAIKRMPVQEFLQNRIGNAALEIERTTVEGGVMVWKLYNHGFVVSTAGVTIGFDLVCPSARFDNFLYDTRDDLIRIISRCDVLFVSHQHEDHADEWVAGKFLEQGKPVVAPPGVFKDQPFSSKVFYPERDPAKKHVLPVKNGSKELRITVYPGHQTRIINNVPVIYTPEGFCIAHTGDQNLREENMQDATWINSLKDHHKIDILLYGAYMPSLLIPGFNPELIIPGHENELRHKMHKRVPFREIRNELALLPYPFILMTWGEKYYYKSN